MTKFKRSLRLLLIPLLLLTTFVSVSAKAPTRIENYYYDEMNVLTEATKESIVKGNNTLKKRHGAQIVVATISDLEGQDAFSYSVDMFQNLGIAGEDNNGVLIMLARETADENSSTNIEIRIGYGLEATLTDGKVGRIIDEYMLESFIKGDLDKGLNDGFNEITNQVKLFYGDEDGTSEPEGTAINIGRLMTIIRVGFYILGVYLMITGKGRFIFIGGNPFGGSSSGGRSSSGRSSSGGSFRGGGGRTGGGGAGRRF